MKPRLIKKKPVRPQLRKVLAGEELKAKVRDVISSLGIKQEPFNVEKRYSAEERKKIDNLYSISESSVQAKKEFYDITASSDLNVISDNLEHRVEDLEFLLSKPPKKGQKVLDLASGSTLTPVIAERLTKAQYYAVDLSREMLEQSKKLGNSRVSKVQGLAEKLPYKSGVFNEVWNENPDRLEEESLKEAHRVLKKGGVFKMVARTNSCVNKKSLAESFNRHGFVTEVMQKGIFVTITARKK